MFQSRLTFARIELCHSVGNIFDKLPDLIQYSSQFKINNFYWRLLKFQVELERFEATPLIIKWYD